MAPGGVVTLPPGSVVSAGGSALPPGNVFVVSAGTVITVPPPPPPPAEDAVPPAPPAPGAAATPPKPGTVLNLPAGTLVLVPATTPAGSPPVRPKKAPPKLIPLTIGDRFLGVGLTLTDVLVSGAAIVSLGLLLATWIKRLGRAVAASVVIYLAMSVGWIFALEILESMMNPARFNPATGGYEANGAPWWYDSLWLVSPVASIAPMEALAESAREPRMRTWLCILAALAIKAGFAAIAFELTVRTFDRALGRVVESKPAGLARAEARRARLSGRAAGLVTPAAS